MALEVEPAWVGTVAGEAGLGPACREGLAPDWVCSVVVVGGIVTARAAEIRGDTYACCVFVGRPEELFLTGRRIVAEEQELIAAGL